MPFNMWNTSGELTYADANAFTAVNLNDCIDEVVPPIGSVVAWLKSMVGVPTTLPNGWIECSWGVPPLNGAGLLADTDSPFNGQIIPDLNGAVGEKRFLRGSTTSGTTVTNTSHIHTCGDNDIYYNNVYGGGEHWTAPNPHVHEIYSSTYGGWTHLPSYHNVVFIMRIK